MVSIGGTFYAMLFATVMAQVTALSTSYSLGSTITFTVTDSNDFSQTTVLLANDNGPHPFSASIQTQQTKISDISVTLPEVFAVGKGFYFKVIYQGNTAASYKTTEFEILGVGFAIADSSLSFNFPTRDIVLDVDVVYDVSYTQNYVKVPNKLTATLIRADSVDFGVFPLQDAVNPDHLTFEWLVGTDFQTSKYYYIYIEAEFTESKSGSFSPKFAINNPNDVSSADGVNVKFQFPKSQDVLLINKQYSISWDYLVEPSSTVELQLLNTNNAVISNAGTLGQLDNIPSSDVSGSFSFIVPSVVPGNFYQILLTGKINDQFVFSELSQVFTIDTTNNDGIIFTLPNSDSLYVVNEAYDVNFNFIGTKSPKSITFDLAKGAFNTFQVDQAISNNASSLADFVDGASSELTFRVPVFTISSIITLNYDDSAISPQDGFTFQIPFFVTSGHDYFIKASINYKDGTSKTTNSPTFTVQGDQDPSVVQVSLPIPGQMLKIGQVYNIGWTLHALGAIDYLTLQLFHVVDTVEGEQVVSSVSLVKTIADNIASSKLTYMWTVEDGLDTAGGYYIRVIGHSGENEIIGVGGEFFIGTVEVPLKFRVKRDYRKTVQMIENYK